MADDEYTLPEDDPCHTTLEAYKRYVTPYIDDYWQVYEYKQYVAKMEQWQQCCPGKENSSVKFRPDKTPVELNDICLPPIFSSDAPCRNIFNVVYQAIGVRWFKKYSDERFVFWYNHYSDINQNLYDCCTVRFKKCLEQAPPTSAASASCLEAFSPEYQQQAAAERAAAQAKQQSEAVPDVRKGKEDTGTGQSGKGLQNVVVSAAPRPGIEVLAGFPSGSGSAAFVIFGIVVLTAGYFLGWPGRSRRVRTTSGGVSALIALGVYLVSVALLPDTRFFELLYAVTAAVLVVAFRALVRSQLELRRSGQAPPSP